MELTLHRRGAETAEAKAERDAALRLSQRSLRLRGEFPSKTGSCFLTFPKAGEVFTPEFRDFGDPNPCWPTLVSGAILCLVQTSR